MLIESHQPAFFGNRQSQKIQIRELFRPLDMDRQQMSRVAKRNVIRPELVISS